MAAAATSDRIPLDLLVQQMVGQVQSFPLIAIPFFMLTGFHGFHVTLGAIMLAVVLVRLMRGHFTAENHFGFEGAAWYWHFVDVVWLGLYLVIYWM